MQRYSKTRYREIQKDTENTKDTVNKQDTENAKDTVNKQNTERSENAKDTGNKQDTERYRECKRYSKTRYGEIQRMQKIQ